MHCALNAFMSPESSGDAIGAVPGTTRMTKVAMSIGKAVETQYVVKRLQEECHRQNRKRRVVRDIYADGVKLRAQLQAEGDLSDEGWREWFALGDALRHEGELLPLDHMAWFADTSVEERLKAMAAARGYPETVAASTESRSGKGILATRARRLLQEPGNAEWPADVHAKVRCVWQCWVWYGVKGTLVKSGEPSVHG
jgi:hypothetical protein